MNSKLATRIKEASEIREKQMEIALKCEIIKVDATTD